MSDETNQVTRKPVIWILVMDSKQAQIYVRKRTDKISLTENPKHRHFEEASEMELVPVGPVLHAEHYRSEPSSYIGDENRTHFVKALATHLNLARSQRQFSRLVLIAPAKLLGELRAHLNKTVVMSVMAELSKDLVHCDNKALAAHVQELA